MSHNHELDEGASLLTGGQTESSPTVLIVEDNSDGSLLLGQLLKMIGYRPIFAQNGLEALDCIDQELPHVILSDIRMPEMDGLEMAEVIRSTDPWRHLHMIAHTGLGSVTETDEIIAAGFNQILVKPVPLKMLEDALRRAVSQSLKSIY